MRPTSDECSGLEERLDVREALIIDLGAASVLGVCLGARIVVRSPRTHATC